MIVDIIKFRVENLSVAFMHSLATCAISAHAYREGVT